MLASLLRPFVAKIYKTEFIAWKHQMFNASRDFKVIKSKNKNTCEF